MDISFFIHPQTSRHSLSGELLEKFRQDLSPLSVWSMKLTAQDGPRSRKSPATHSETTILIPSVVSGPGHYVRKGKHLVNSHSFIGWKRQVNDYQIRTQMCHIIVAVSVRLTSCRVNQSVSAPIDRRQVTIDCVQHSLQLLRGWPSRETTSFGPIMDGRHERRHCVVSYHLTSQLSRYLVYQQED